MYIKDPKDLIVQYGTNELKPDKPKFTDISKIRKHEGYSHTIAIHDIAILKLKSAFKFNKTDFVDLVEEKYCTAYGETEEPAVLVGWGLNETNGALQQQLLKVPLNLLTTAECCQQTQSLLHSTNLCAAAANGTTQGQCSGDSGGPLLLKNKQIGIVSWSLKPCGFYPGIFTNVGCYAKWINEWLEK